MASPDEGGGDQQQPAPPLTVGHHTTSRQPLSHMKLHLAAAFGLAMSPTIARSLSPTAVPSPTTPGDDLQQLYPSHATLQPPHSHHPHQIPLITSPSQTCVSNHGQSRVTSPPATSNDLLPSIVSTRQNSSCISLWPFLTPHQPPLMSPTTTHHQQPIFANPCS